MDLSGTTFFFPWEVALIEWLQEHVGAVGAVIASFFSAFGEEIISVGILGLLYWGIDKRLGKKTGINMLAAVVWNPMIKNVFLRRRPYFDHAGIACLKPVDSRADIYDIAAQGYSFPSGHSTNSVTLYGSLALFGKKKWLTVLAFVLPFLCGVSRFVLGVHYPTDVLAGWALGVVVIIAVSFLQEKIRNRWVFYLFRFARRIHRGFGIRRAVRSLLTDAESVFHRSAAPSRPAGLYPAAQRIQTAFPEGVSGIGHFLGLSRPHGALFAFDFPDHGHISLPLPAFRQALRQKARTGTGGK